MQSDRYGAVGEGVDGVGFAPFARGDELGLFEQGLHQSGEEDCPELGAIAPDSCSADVGANRRSDWGTSGNCASL